MTNIFYTPLWALSQCSSNKKTRVKKKIIKEKITHPLVGTLPKTVKDLVQGVLASDCATCA